MVFKYTWVARGTVRVSCLAQGHNTLSPTRARSGDERNNHEATAPPHYCYGIMAVHSFFSLLFGAETLNKADVAERFFEIKDRNS